MIWKNVQPRTRLNLIALAVLLAGLGSAALICQRAGNTAPEVLGYEEVNGKLYPILPEDSKSYQRNMELYGGKANVLLDRFRRWFAGLWQGKSLARIIAAAAVIISLGLFYAARRLPPL
jgi:hypothetical protein